MNISLLKIQRTKKYLELVPQAKAVEQTKNWQAADRLWEEIWGYAVSTRDRDTELLCLGSRMVCQLAIISKSGKGELRAF